MDDTLNRILSLLKERNIARGKFLHDLGFNKSAISGWESGEYSSYRKKPPEIAEYFDVSLDWLAGAEQKSRPPKVLDDLSPVEKELIMKLRAAPPEEAAVVYRAYGVNGPKKK